MRLTSILVLTTAAAILLAHPGCRPGGRLMPRAGFVDRDELLSVAVPGGSVVLAGGNLVVRQVDLSIDTRLSTFELSRTYNSADSVWRWSFELRRTASVFVDSTGAEHDLSNSSAGTPVPGTRWVDAGPAAIETRGGLRYEFASSGELAIIRYKTHDFPRIVLDWSPGSPRPRLAAIRQCVAVSTCSSVMTFQSTTTGRPLSVTDRAGRVVEYGYDPATGRLASARDGFDVQKSLPGHRFHYQDDDLVAIETPDGELVTYLYDDAHRLREARIGSLAFSFRYMPKDAAGLFRTLYLAPSGAETLYAYDGQRRLRRVVDPAGNETTVDWQGLRPSRRVDPSGPVTSWTYQEDRLVAWTTRAGNTIHFEYEPAAVNTFDLDTTPLRRSWDSLGPLADWSYGPDGLPETWSNGEAEVTTYEYDGLAQLTAVTEPSGTVTRMRSYGDHGHPTRLVRGQLQLDLSYDAVGNLVQGPGLDHGALSLLVPGVERRAFDANRNVERIDLESISPGGTASGTVVFSRRSDGMVTYVDRPLGGDTRLVYDAAGRLVERRERADGAWSSTFFEYDALGRMISAEKANGMRTEWGHDAADRIATTRILRDGTVEATRDVTYENGRVSAVHDSNHAGAETYDYDASGRVSVVRYPDGERKEIAYDVRSRKTSERFVGSGGLQVAHLEYAYDDVDRPVAILESGTPVVEREFSGGRVSALLYGNGLRTDIGYDPATGVVSIARTTDASGQAIASSSLDVTAVTTVPRHLRIEATADVVGQPLIREAYVFLGLVATPAPRVAAWSPRWPDAITLYGYDALGNLTSRTDTDSGLAEDLVYNAEHNRLHAIVDAATGSALHSYVYDESGYAVARDGEPITYDGAGRLTGIGPDVSLAWDVQGALVSRSAGSLTSTMRFGAAVEEVSDGRILLDVGPAVLRLDSGARTYRHWDFRGNVRFETDDGGTVVRANRYHPFGRDSAVPLAPETRSFARGMELGSLTVLGHRAYEPEAARFLSPDPLPQPYSDYAYAMGNPVYFWDPTGMESSFAESFGDIGAQIGGGAGGFIGGVRGGARGAAVGTAIGAATGRAVGYAVGLGADRAVALPGRMARAYELSHQETTPPAVRGSGAPVVMQRDDGSSPTSSDGQKGSPKAELTKGSSRTGASGCLSRCVGPARWHGPNKKPKANSGGGGIAAGTGGGFGGSSFTGGCAGPLVAAEYPSAIGWLELLGPSLLVVSALLWLSARRGSH